MQVNFFPSKFADRFNFVHVAPLLGFEAGKATPLFHTNLLPDLMQVNFFPPELAV